MQRVIINLVTNLSVLTAKMVRLSAIVLALAILWSVVGIWIASTNLIAEKHGEKQAVLIWVGGKIAAKEVIIGRANLLQNKGRNSAADRHVLFRKSGNKWLISNVATNRKLLLRYSNNVEFLSNRHIVKLGDQAILLGKNSQRTIITITKLSEFGISVSVNNQGSGASNFHISSDEFVTTLEGRNASNNIEVSEACKFNDDLISENSSWARKLKTVFSLDAGQEFTIARFGGSVSCVRDNTAAIAIDGLQFNSVRIVKIPGMGFAFAPGSARHVEMHRAGAIHRLQETPHQIVLSTAKKPVNLSNITIGRTKYRVEMANEIGQDFSFKLFPTDNNVRVQIEKSGICKRNLSKLNFDLNCADGPITIDKWMGFIDRLSEKFGGKIGATIFTSILAVFSLIIAPITGVLIVQRLWAGQAEFESLGFFKLFFMVFFVSLVFAIFFVTAMPGIKLADLGGNLVNSPYFSIVAWGCATSAYIAAPNTGFHSRAFLILVTILIAIGGYGLSSLAFASGELRFARFHEAFYSYKGLGLASMMIAVSSLMPPNWIRTLSSSLAMDSYYKWRLASGLTFVIFVGIVALTVWLILGSETGIAGVFQPSEVIKSMLALAWAGILMHFLRKRFALRTGPSWQENMFAIFLILLVLGAVTFAPVVRSDHSPLLIIFLTINLASFLILIMHYRTQLAERINLFLLYGHEPAPNLRIKKEFTPTTFMKIRGVMTRKIVGEFLSTHVIEIGLICSMILLTWSTIQLNKMEKEPKVYSRIFEENMKGVVQTPMTRARSWIELRLPKEPGQRGILPVEYPDTGQQVIRSRELIFHSRCKQTSIVSNIANSSSLKGSDLISSIVRNQLKRVQNWLKSHCNAEGLSDEKLEELALRLPAIHNDFIASWMFVVLGRDGAVLLVFLQVLIIVGMLWAALRTASWHHIDGKSRIASGVLSYALVGFSCMLALQYSISWANAFGIIPVMGQPMSMVSAGNSHMLAFSMPAIITTLFCFRLIDNPVIYKFNTLPRIPAKFIRWSK